MIFATLGFLISSTHAAQCLSSVENSFININHHGRANYRIANNKIIPGLRYTQSPTNRFGLDNHFQGVLQISKSPELYALSGGDFIKKKGHVFFSTQDRLISKIEVGSAKHWHPGGMALFDSVLIVPSEDFKVTHTADIEFIDIENVRNPVKLPITIYRRHRNSGAVGIERGEDGYLYLASYSGGIVDFYRSRTIAIRDGFNPDPIATWDSSALILTPGTRPGFGGSSLGLIRQCDGQLFAISFENDGDLAPVINGRNWAELYSIKLDFTSQVQPQSVLVTKLKSREFECGKYCNFAAATGAQVLINSMGHPELEFISTRHFRSRFGTQIKLRKF